MLSHSLASVYDRYESIVLTHISPRHLLGNVVGHWSHAVTASFSCQNTAHRS
jgi:hypothetical protein